MAAAEGAFRRRAVGCGSVLGRRVRSLRAGHYRNLSILSGRTHLFANFDRRPLTHVSAYIDAMPASRHRGIGPQEDVARVDRCEVYAAVAARGAEDVVPISAVQRVTRREILNPGHVAQLEVRRTAAHGDAVLGVPAFFAAGKPACVVFGKLLTLLFCLLEPRDGGGARACAGRRLSPRAASNARVL